MCLLLFCTAFKVFSCWCQSAREIGRVMIYDVDPAPWQVASHSRRRKSGELLRVSSADDPSFELRTDGVLINRV